MGYVRLGSSRLFSTRQGGGEAGSVEGGEYYRLEGLPARIEGSGAVCKEKGSSEERSVIMVRYWCPVRDYNLWCKERWPILLSLKVCALLKWERHMRQWRCRVNYICDTYSRGTCV